MDEVIIGAIMGTIGGCCLYLVNESFKLKPILLGAVIGSAIGMCFFGFNPNTLANIVLMYSVFFGLVYFNKENV